MTLDNSNYFRLKSVSPSYKTGRESTTYAKFSYWIIPDILSDFFPVLRSLDAVELKWSMGGIGAGYFLSKRSPCPSKF